MMNVKQKNNVEYLECQTCKKKEEFDCYAKAFTKLVKRSLNLWFLLIFMLFVLICKFLCHYL